MGRVKRLEIEIFYPALRVLFFLQDKREGPEPLEGGRLLWCLR